MDLKVRVCETSIQDAFSCLAVWEKRFHCLHQLWGIFPGHRGCPEMSFYPKNVQDSGSSGFDKVWEYSAFPQYRTFGRYFLEFSVGPKGCEVAAPIHDYLSGFHVFRCLQREPLCTVCPYGHEYRIGSFNGFLHV